MSHVAVFAVLILDLMVGGQAVEKFGGELAMSGFEFVLILGYIIFVLQWGVPWGQRSNDDS